MTEQETNPEQQINRVLLSGRLARDPELLELPNGEPVCLLRLACATGRRVVGGSRDGLSGHVKRDRARLAGEADCALPVWGPRRGRARQSGNRVLGGGGGPGARGDVCA